MTRLCNNQEAVRQAAATSVLKQAEIERIQQVLAAPGGFLPTSLDAVGEGIDLGLIRLGLIQYKGTGLFGDGCDYRFVGLTNFAMRFVRGADHVFHQPTWVDWGLHAPGNDVKNAYCHICAELSARSERK